MKSKKLLNVSDTVYLINSSQILTCQVTQVLPHNIVIVNTGSSLVRLPRNLPLGYETYCNKLLYYVTLDHNDVISRTLMKKKHAKEFENMSVILKHVSQNLIPEHLENLTKELQVLSNKYYAYTRIRS